MTLIFKMIVSGYLLPGLTLFEFLPLGAQLLMPLLCSMLGPQPLVVCSLQSQDMNYDFVEQLCNVCYLCCRVGQNAVGL